MLPLRSDQMGNGYKYPSPSKFTICDKRVLISVIFLFSFTIPFSSAQYISLGLCPKVFGMSDFNITRYEGRWYEVEKYWFVFEATASCVSVEYLDNHDGTFAVEINQYEHLTAKQWMNPGVTRYLSRDGSADFVLDLIVTQSPVPFRFKYPYIVVDTDYVSYTIKYHCQQVGFVNIQTMWILSRDRTFSPEARKRAYDKLRRLGLDSTRLTISNQANCPASYV